MARAQAQRGPLRTCEENSFCKSLPDELRHELCKGCRRRLSKAGSIDVYEHFVDKSTIVLDGLMVSRSCPDNDAGALEEIPQYSFCMPGRLLNQNVMLDMVSRSPISYVSVDFLTDCCIATFEHSFIATLYESSIAFARTVNESAVMLMHDLSRYAGIMRAEGLANKIILLLEHLLEYGLYLSELQIANVIACDRTSVSRAKTVIRAQRPELLDAYASIKKRAIVMLNPL